VYGTAVILRNRFLSASGIRTLALGISGTVSPPYQQPGFLFVNGALLTVLPVCVAPHKVVGLRFIYQASASDEANNFVASVFCRRQRLLRSCGITAVCTQSAGAQDSWICQRGPVQSKSTQRVVTDVREPTRARLITSLVDHGVCSGQCVCMDWVLIKMCCGCVSCWIVVVEVVASSYDGQGTRLDSVSS